MLASQRLAVLIDSENLEITVQQCYGTKSRSRTKSGSTTRGTQQIFPDWKKILPAIVRDRTLVRNIYYKKRGLMVSEKFRTFWEGELGGEIKQPIKSVDPYIIVDAITVCEKVDVLVIVAGDKDYLPLIWFLRSKGCKVEVVSFGQAAAEIIKNAADRFVMLDKEHTVVLRRTASTTTRRRRTA